MIQDFLSHGISNLFVYYVNFFCVIYKGRWLLPFSDWKSKSKIKINNKIVFLGYRSLEWCLVLNTFSQKKLFQMYPNWFTLIFVQRHYYLHKNVLNDVTAASCKKDTRNGAAMTSLGTVVRMWYIVDLDQHFFITRVHWWKNNVWA